MDSDTLISEMAVLRDKKHAAALTAFRQLARDLVDGSKKTLTPSHLLEITTAADKTDADLKSEKAAYSNRVTAAQVLAKEKGLMSRLHVVNGDIAKEEAKLQAAQSAFKLAVDPLEKLRNDLNGGLAAVASAKRSLQDSCTDAAILTEIEEIDTKLMELNTEFHRLNATAAEAERLKERIVEIEDKLDGKAPDYATNEELIRNRAFIESTKVVDKLIAANRNEYNVLLPNRRAELELKKLVP